MIDFVHTVQTKVTYLMVDDEVDEEEGEVGVEEEEVDDEEEVFDVEEDEVDVEKAEVVDVRLWLLTPSFTATLSMIDSNGTRV